MEPGWVDPHRENVRNEEQIRQEIRKKAMKKKGK